MKDKTFLKQAYKFVDSENYLNSFSVEEAKEFLLNNYTFLDSIYDLLERANVVNRYSKFRILKDIVLYENYGELFIENEISGNLEQFNIKTFALEAYKMYKL